MEVDKPEASPIYRFTSVMLAFLIWGLWGYFINRQTDDPGSTSPVVSGLIQGTGSSLITLIMLKSVTSLYHWLGPHPLRLVIPAIITSTATASCMTVAHVVAGTSHPLATIAPGMVVAFVFNVATAVNLSRAQRQTARMSQQES